MRDLKSETPPGGTVGGFWTNSSGQLIAQESVPQSPSPFNHSLTRRDSRRAFVLLENAYVGIIY